MESSWKPHDGPQTLFCQRGEFEAFYGGAAGPGKTDCLVALALRYVWHPGYRGILFRRTFPELEEIEDRTLQLYPLAVQGAEYKASRHYWHFPSGAQIYLGHMQHEKDKYKYRGRQFQFIGFDELTAFTNTQYLYLFSRARSPYPELRPIVRSTSNPGDIGHDWVKRRFRIGLVPPGTTIFEEILLPGGEVKRMSRIFIPGRLTDNPTLLENDPEYLARLALLPEHEARRLSEGIWEAEGTAFPELNEDVHQFDFDVPPEWQVFGAFDWGSSKPWSYGLYAVDYEDRIWRFAEAYGAKQDPVSGEYLDEGLRQNDVEIARQILDLEGRFGVKPAVRVACKATFAERPNAKGVTGPAPAETMQREGVFFVRGDQDRIAGRRQLHHRLRLNDEEPPRPWFLVHKRCAAWWQTVPTMVEDENNPEDVAEKGMVDHCYEETRMALMSRPIRPTAKARSDAGSFQAERRKYLEAKRFAARRGLTLSAAYGRR